MAKPSVMAAGKVGRKFETPVLFFTVYGPTYSILVVSRDGIEPSLYGFGSVRVL